MNNNSKNISPKVSLVGAGPGDVDLITVKGMKALQTADVVLYDALSNAELLDYAPKDAIKIYVGKRVNNHRFAQEEINYMLVEYALEYGHVVRLKGGDSFVFGRGHEELQYVQAFGIETTVVPGISSCIAVPELQEIPLTRRGVNESFWVLTGTTQNGRLSKDIAIAAQSTATVVILMGMRKLHQITAAFSKEGKGNMPVLVVQDGSTSTESKVLGTVDTINQAVKDKKIGTPAIIIIGEVVHLHPDLNYSILLEKNNWQKRA